MSKFYVRCTKTRDDRFIKGKVYEITSEKGITDEDGYAGHTRGNKGFDAWHRACGWAEYDFELYAPSSYELHITCNDGKTTDAVYKVNGKIEKRTEAVCAPSDTFDFATGAQTAFDRVFPKVIPAQPPQPIAPQEDKPWFKVGDKVKSIGGWYEGEIGTIVQIDDKRSEALYQIKFPSTLWWKESHTLEPYSEPSLTVTRETLTKLGACSSGLAEFDDKFPSGVGEYEEVCRVASPANQGWLHDRKDRIAEMQNEQPKEAVKLYCVKDHTNYSGSVTQGKVYEFVSGQGITYDNGGVSVCKDSYKNWARVTFETSPCLVPLVKRPAKVGEWVLWDDELFEVIALDKHDANWCYVRNVSGGSNKQYIDRGVSCNCSYLSLREYLVLDNYRPEPEKEPEPVYYSGEVICANDGNMYHTKGRKYVFKDGVVNSDDERQYNPKRPVKTLKEFNEYAIPQFIPYLGE